MQNGATHLLQMSRALPGHCGGPGLPQFLSLELPERYFSLLRTVDLRGLFDHEKLCFMFVLNMIVRMILCVTKRFARAPSGSSQAQILLAERTTSYINRTKTLFQNIFP